MARSNAQAALKTLPPPDERLLTLRKNHPNRGLKIASHLLVARPKKTATASRISLFPKIPT